MIYGIKQGTEEIKQETKKARYGQMHLHTPASDGLITPKDIIDAGLDFVCITDHDSMQNVEAYRSALEPRGIRVVSGVEITTTHSGKDLHVILYEPRSNDGDFYGRLDLMKKRRMERALEINQRLRAEGFCIDDEFIIKQNGAISKGNITDEILKSGKNKEFLAKQGIYTNSEFINAYLEEGCPAHVKMKRIILAEYLRGTDAIRVLAHPAKDLDPIKDDHIIEDLVSNYGFSGVETITRDRNGNEMINYNNLAAELDIIGLRSNDCHVREQLYSRMENEETLDNLLGYHRPVCSSKEYVRAQTDKTFLS